MKHFKKNVSVNLIYLKGVKSYLLRTITSHKLRKGYKKKEICLHPFFSLSLSLSFFSLSLFLVALFGLGKFLYNLIQQGDDCVFKDLYAISFYDAQYMAWTDNDRSSYHSTRGFQAAKRKVMGHSIGIFTES